MKNYSVYVLKDANTSGAFYVGCSCDPQKRLSAHFTKRGGPVLKYINKNRIEKSDVLMRIVYISPCPFKARLNERRLIKLLSKVTNLSNIQSTNQTGRK